MSSMPRDLPFSSSDPKPPPPPLRPNSILEHILSPRMVDPFPSFFQPTTSTTTTLSPSTSMTLPLEKEVNDIAALVRKRNRSVPSSPTSLLRPTSPTRFIPLQSPPVLDNHLDLGDTAKLRRVATINGPSWVSCFGIVGFDLEVGPVIEHVYPPTSFSDEAKNVIRFTSFPDSSSNILEDICFSFCFQDAASLSCTPSDNAIHMATLKSKKPALTYFAYVFFRQKPDPSIRRGFFQKSVVLISRFAAHDVFLAVMRSLGPLVLDKGPVVLETAFEQIQQWPLPEKGLQQLPLLGTMVMCEVVCHWKDAFPTQVLTKPLNLSVLFPTFQNMIPKLWTLWEIMLVGDPIAIIAKCPSKCTEAVLGLLSLISPVSSALDYRTYLTIQDPSSKHLFKSSTPPKTIVGISNPFFFPTLRHWPHVLQLASPSNLSHVVPALKVDFRHGLTTKHRRIVSRDKSVLDAVAKGLCQGSFHHINQVLQKHFCELTERFLSPLQLFLDTLWPTSLTLLSPFPIDPHPFRIDECLQFVKDRPVAIPIKSILSDWVQLYRTFLHSATFSKWLTSTMLLRARSWHQRYISILCATDLKQWASKQAVREVHMVLSRIATIKEVPDARTILNDQEHEQLNLQESILHSILDTVKPS